MTEITTEAEFETALTALFREAHRNGVDVRGGWTVDDGDVAPKWDIVVTVIDTEN